MADRKIKMARGDEVPQGHTIVGGRPTGKQDLGKNIPRGMELLIKKAAVDPEFCKKLIAERENAASQLGINLDSSEKIMISKIPENQLQEIIRKTSVPANQRNIFLGTSAAAMMALIAQLTFTPVAGRAETSPNLLPLQGRQLVKSPENWEGGHRPDIPEPQSKGCRPDFPMPPGGARPDEPDILNPPTPLPPVSETDHLLKRKTVNQEVRGKLFLEAIKILQDEIGSRIEVEVPSGMDISWTVSGSTRGQSLEEALQTLCGEQHLSEFSPQIIFNQNQVTIRFLKTGNDSPGLQPSNPDVKPRPDGVTRGIRPDNPTTGTGSRPD